MLDGKYLLVVTDLPTVGLITQSYSDLKGRNKSLRAVVITSISLYFGTSAQ